MRAVVQRVSRGAVLVDTEIIGEIGIGMVVLLGVAVGDADTHVEILSKKIYDLRIFEDDRQRMNLSVQDVGGQILVVSQFTLLADCRKGRRPSFTRAAPPESARRLYRAFVESLRRRGAVVATGRFGADMDLRLVNDGPVTLIVDTDALSTGPTP